MELQAKALLSEEQKFSDPMWVQSEAFEVESEVLTQKNQDLKERQ